jgi:hypothetical protein
LPRTCPSWLIRCARRAVLTWVLESFETTAAGVLALTGGLGSSVLGGQRHGQAALAVLTCHLDRVFRQ